MDCLICHSLWKAGEDISDSRSPLHSLTSEAAFYFAKLLGLTRGVTKENLPKCDLCQLCADKISKVKVLMKQLESLEKQISNFRDELQAQMVNSYLEQAGKEVEATEITRLCRSDILYELQLVVEFKSCPKKICDDVLQEVEVEEVYSDSHSIHDEDTDVEEEDEMVTAVKEESSPSVQEVPDTNQNLEPVTPEIYPSEVTAIEVNAIEVPLFEFKAIEAPAVEVKAVEEPAITVEAITVPAMEVKAVEVFEVPAIEVKTAEVPAIEVKIAEVKATEVPPIEAPAMEVKVVEIKAPKTDKELVILVERLSPSFIESMTKKSGIKQRKKKFKPDSYACDHCNKIVKTKRQLHDHLVCHKERTHICSTCSKGFRTKYLLRQHETTHIPEESIKCEKCNLCVRDKIRLRNHLKYFCKGDESGSSVAGLTRLRGNKKELTVFTCPHCKITFTTRAKLQSHLQTLHNELKFPCITCGEMFGKKQELRRHELAHGNLTLLKCEKCPRHFRNPGNLERHHRICNPGAVPAEPEESTLCPHCAKVFPSSRKLYQHLRCHSERKYACKLCPQKFPLPASLKRHVATHFPDRPFVCEFCGKGYKDHGTLWHHRRQGCSKIERVHIKCEVCGNVFKHDHNREKHRRLHDGEPEKDLFPVPCDSCDLWFESQEDMGYHRAFVHLQEFSCGTCNKTFDNWVIFARHRQAEHSSPITRTEAGEWKCPTCPFVSSSKHRLDRHFTTHTEKSPYACSKCENRYRTESAMRRHLRKVHNVVKTRHDDEGTQLRKTLKCIRK